MTVKEYLEKTQTEIWPTKIVDFQMLRPKIICNDGFYISVQASKGHYCSPRENGLGGGYDEIELGYPSEKDDLIMDYVEDPGHPTKTVYGYVPIEIVEELINKHGGIKE